MWLRRLKNSLRCALVVATFTMRQLRRMYSWISALIQCMAYDTRRTFCSRVEALHGLHQADIAFLDQVGVRQAVTQVIARDRYDQPQVRQHELARGLEVVVVAKFGGELAFFRRRQHRNPVYGRM